MTTSPRCHVLRSGYFFLLIIHHPLDSKTVPGDSKPSMISINVEIDLNLLQRYSNNNNILEFVVDWYKMNQDLSMKINYSVDLLITQSRRNDVEINNNIFTTEKLIDAIHKCGPYRFRSNGKQRNGARFI